MPELPEVQTIVSGLRDKVIGKKIVSLEELRPQTIRNFIGKDILDFGIISEISRRGKYIIIGTSERIIFIIHLRMTGKLIYNKEFEYLSFHARAIFLFSDETKLIFDDTRAFGKIDIYKQNDKIESLEKLGPEPLLEKYNEKYLQKIFHQRKSPVKNLLLNQSIVAGLGNIYVCEILYRAEVNPQVSGKKLLPKQIRKIVEKTKTVLGEAILHNGTTISDYRNVDDKTGEFQNFLRVYQKKKCPKGHRIRKIKQAGRSTYYCPECQKSASQRVSKSASQQDRESGN